MINRGMSWDVRFILKFFRFGQYFFNRKKNIIYLIPYVSIKLVYCFFQILYGFSIPFSTKIGKNVCFKHGFFGIFISSEAVIGDNVIIMHQVTIGSNFASGKDITAPKIGNDVFIGPGAKIIGAVFVESGTKIGANALLVNQNCEKGVYISPKATKI